MAETSNGLKHLPKTIEGAEQRYIDIYERLFRGFQDEKKVLVSKTRAKTIVLRTKAPKFYENKLPALLNQAGSTLLSCDMNTNAGLHKFNQTHRYLLLILDDLRKNQPEGEVNFQTERERYILKDDLKMKHLKKRDEISQLEAQEFTNEELGSENDGPYSRCMKLLDQKRAEFKKVAMLLAKLQGESTEEELEFELKIPPRSILQRLDDTQRSLFEELILDFLRENNHKNGLFINMDVIEDILLKLDIDMDTFSKDEWRDLSKEALDASKRYFRDKENALRNEYFDELIKDKYLMPKEGIILANPDDLPDEIKERLEKNERAAKRKIEELEEDFAKRPALEENEREDVIEEDEDEDDVIRKEVEEIVKSSAPEIFARVKEEPRDDYEGDAPSDDEFVASEHIADRIDQSLGHAKSNRNGPVDNGNELSDDDISDFEEALEGNDPATINGRSSAEPSSSTNPFHRDAPKEINLEEASAELDKFLDEDSDEYEDSEEPPKRQCMNGDAQLEQNSQGDESQGLDCLPLGIVTPQEKIDLITIDD